MYSPSDKKPGEKDFKHSVFDSGMSKDPQAYFDTFLVLERMDIIDPTKIKGGGKVFGELASNDDSSEMHANPGGQTYNSLLRHASEPNDPLKALVRGVYRITFTSFRGGVTGSYIATIGTNIPGVVVASSLEELHKLVNK